MPKVYSVDAAIKKNRPYVELRGRLYEVRDISVRERLEKIDEFRRKQNEHEKAIDKPEEDITFEDIQKVIAEAVQVALIGVPDEVANSLTEREWQLVQQILQEIQQDEFPVKADEVDEVDENLVGPESKS